MRGEPLQSRFPGVAVREGSYYEQSKPRYHAKVTLHFCCMTPDDVTEFRQSVCPGEEHVDQNESALGLKPHPQ